MRPFYYILFLLFLSCGNEIPKYTFLDGNAFGTTYAIQFFSDSSFDAEKGIDSVIYSVNKSVSTYMPNSDISRINRGDSTIVVDEIFKKVFQISKTVHQNSQGYFDPTVGVLRNAYGFGDVKPLDQIDKRILDSLMHYVGFHKVSISNNGTVKKKHPQIYFDFNAVAKGYGIDLIGDYLERQGIENFIIELGGEILTRGKNLAKDKPWIAAVEAVDSELTDRSYSVKVALKDEAMAASGNYRKFRIDSITGRKYVHTINPITGSAEKSDVTSATIIAPSCALADAYATACMALGLKKAKEMLEVTSEIEAYLTYTDSLSSTKVFVTKGFKNHIVD